ncbi:MAG: bifunctional (p)ppGpp synthetase/guanosine-3',5'-bis(diphosphate) 3'-pyrophosphohydrolase [Clostridia bacterium]|nr:bifunctional (p)ppGpp synthetase/guanosine-3',5'-bis(diphosphate) 3'-pyrophosphohydrolase [Clostridia bacterium]
MPEELFEKLKEKVMLYNNEARFELIEKAYETAKQMHADQKRKSGEPYIIHPLSVAIIIAELELDVESICAALLHDVVEDTVMTKEDITEQFGEEVALIVEGVTKLTSITYQNATTQDKEEVQAENYRRMFLAMSNDIRVILIKLADRLHNMRTLKYQPEDRQKAIAKETLDIYAPLANRLGISKIKIELEDLSLRYLYPDIYYDLVAKINIRKVEREAIIQDIIDKIDKELKNAEIDGEVKGRAKHFFSIYKKMKGKSKSIDEIYDLFAVRVIVNTVRDCYEVLGIMHELYKPMPGRFKDYIAMPKANMYQSLHSTLLDDKGNPFEVQIRTHEMHRVAENGIAAHWMYKEGKKNTNDKLAEKLVWLKEVLEWRKSAASGKEFVENIKLDLDVFNDEVYVFSPRGDVIALPQGSTPIDFAYMIHSAVGNKMVGAKVNDKIVTLDYNLKTGDRVEVLTSQNTKGPSRDWLNLVKSPQAKQKIQMWFKNLSKEDSIERGRQILEEAAQRKGVRLDELLKPEWMDYVVERYGLKTFDAIYALVGHGDVRESQVINRLYSQYEKTNKKEVTLDEVLEKTISSRIDKESNKHSKTKSGIVVSGVDDVAVKFAKCCSPVPGDEIVGYITKGRGISIHRTDCKNIISLNSDEARKLVEAMWGEGVAVSNNMYYNCELKIISEDRSGLLIDVTKLITDSKVPLKGVEAKTVDSKAIFMMTVEISNKDQLEKLVNNLKKIPSVEEVIRISG